MCLNCGPWKCMLGEYPSMLNWLLRMDSISKQVRYETTLCIVFEVEKFGFAGEKKINFMLISIGEKVFYVLQRLYRSWYYLLLKAIEVNSIRFEVYGGDFRTIC